MSNFEKQTDISVYPLTIDRIEGWFSLDENIEIQSRKAELKEYLVANPDLAPESYLLAERDNKIIGKMSGVLESDGYIVTGITSSKAEEPAKVAAIFLDCIGKFGAVRALSWETSDDQNWRTLLEVLEFEIVQKKPYFRRKLEKFISPHEDPFTYRSLGQIGEKEFLRIFCRTYEGNVNANFNNESPESDFKIYVESAGNFFDANAWLAVFFQAQPIGVVLPYRFPDDPLDGTIGSFGIIPEMRGKGYGKVLHAKGLQVLSDQGATDYVGSTDLANAAMIRVFIANGCQQTRVRNVHQQKAQLE